jgi:hypothetical protein
VLQQNRQIEGGNAVVRNTGVDGKNWLCGKSLQNGGQSTLHLGIDRGLAWRLDFGRCFSCRFGCRLRGFADATVVVGDLGYRERFALQIVDDFLSSSFRVKID